MKTLKLSNLIWDNIINPIPPNVLFRVILESEFETEIEIDGENFIKLMEHFDKSGLNRITKDEISALSEIYKNLYNRS